MANDRSNHPTALLEGFSGGRFGRSFRFEGKESVITADTPGQVLGALARVEQAVARGRHAVGFVGYEAAAGLNPDLATRVPSELPLVWFGIFKERIACSDSRDEPADGGCAMTPPALAITGTAYTSAVEAIREAIAAGETYQVNYTTRQHFSVNGDPFSLYRRMCRNQMAPFCAWLDIGSHRILSASPELFFSLEQDLLTMQPMKGTAPRLALPGDDRAQREMLAATPKERAENLMIVDLVRNDLATIAETGSVEVPALFEVETYPTVHQMTSTVTARIRPEIGLTDIFRALFPCGSVTGAPKRRTMEIIRKLEPGPRGVYCGAIGYVSPGREAVFSVAIRTAVVNADSGAAEIGIGSGITWDSDPQAEFRECLAKSAFLQRDSSPFQLIETLRWDQEGYLLLERHLHRLAESAARFGFACDTEQIRCRLAEFARGLSGSHKVRLLLANTGTFTLEADPITPSNRAAEPAVLALSRQRTDPADPFLYHKTSRRELYESERSRHSDCYDVIFRNQQDQLTEGSFNTIVISLQGELLTPALNCGLLPGVLRQELLEVGAIREALLTLDDLQAADAVWMVNSVRGWRECRIS